ncbi:MAG: hypothetical protein ACREEM_07750 [Blastocatellia bacterium]
MPEEKRDRPSTEKKSQSQERSSTLSHEQLETLRLDAEIEKIRFKREMERRRFEAELEAANRQAKSKERIISSGFIIGALLVLAGLGDARWDLFPYIDALKLIFAGAALIGAAMGVKQKEEDKPNDKE